MKEQFLALDVSTSNIGISLWDYDGKLLSLNHISPKIKNSNDEQHENLIKKAKLVVDYISENYSDLREIVIEEPLKSAVTLDVAALLNFFAGMICFGLKSKFPSTKIRYIHIDMCRRFGLPELLAKLNEKSKQATLFSNIPKTIEGVKINEYRKEIIMYLVAKRFPEIIWTLNTNMTIDDKNYDRADSIVVGMAYLNILTEKNMFKTQDVKEAIEFVTENIKYKKYCNTLNGLDKEEKNKRKYFYLKENFKIEKYLNIGL